MITIIPAIDIIDGKCVRLSKGDFSTIKIYNENPLEVAREFEGHGIKRLHMVDLDGARNKKIINWNILEKVAAQTALQIDFGGGIQSNQDIELAFQCGAMQITAGSIAVKNKALVQSWLAKYGSNKIILGADVKNKQIALSGWQETSELPLMEFMKDYYDAGFRQVISTDVSRDGMLTGPAFQLYQSIKQELPDMYVIASGGISSVQEIKKLDEMNIDGVITGKAIYEGRITLKQLEPFLC